MKNARLVPMTRGSRFAFAALTLIALQLAAPTSAKAEGRGDSDPPASAAARYLHSGVFRQRGVDDACDEAVEYDAVSDQVLLTAVNPPNGPCMFAGHVNTFGCRNVEFGYCIHRTGDNIFGEIDHRCADIRVLSDGNFILEDRCNRARDAEFVPR